MKNCVTVSTKVLIPSEFDAALVALEKQCYVVVKRMLKNRADESSKYYKEVPCVVAKSLIAKYQRNPKCRVVRSMIIPVCGDKGKQIKLEVGGIRIPAIFKKSVIPVQWRYKLVGFVLYAEIFKEHGKWWCSIMTHTEKESIIPSTTCIGVDRNSVGNIAVMADPQTGKVRHLGFNPARTKACWRQRKRNLQRHGKKRLLSKLRRNHERRSKHQNHIVSRQIVDNAATHRRAIAVEKLEGVTAIGSKIRSYSEKNNWAFAQLLQMINYKAALRGVTVVEVDPAYTRCGKCHKPSGKVYNCPGCGHKDHRDSNAAFVIAKRGNDVLGGLAKDSVRLRCGLSDGPLSGKEVVTNE